jgi:hypothetical protein
VIGLIAQSVPGIGAADKVTTDLTGGPFVGVIVVVLVIGALLLMIPAKAAHRYGTLMIIGACVFAVVAGGFGRELVVYLMSLGKAG